MAKEVEVWIDNEWVPKTLSEIEPEQYNLKMRCNGCINGDKNNRCTAPMKVTHRRDGSGLWSFTEADGENHPHAIGCENNKKSKYRISSKYDSIGKGKVKEKYLTDLFEKLKLKDISVKNKDKRLKKDKYTDDEAFNCGYKDDDVKPIKSVKKDPPSFSELTKMLEELSPDSHYMDHLVKEWIYDQRTCVYHRAKGMLAGTIIVVGKLWDPRYLDVERYPDEWVIVECAYNSKKGRNWIFCLKCDNEAMSKLKRFSKEDGKDNKYIVVCSEWEQDVKRKNVFKAKLITAERIDFMDKKLFQN